MMDTPVNSKDDNSTGHTSPSVSEIAMPMRVEGKIISIMETWPLQLTVETTAGRYHVSLLPETTVSQLGQPLDTGALQTNCIVQINGQSAGGNTITAELIEVQVL
jgi:hypothetical protein